MAVGHTIYRMKIMFQQKLPKSEYIFWENKNKIFLINSYHVGYIYMVSPQYVSIDEK